MQQLCSVQPIASQITMSDLLDPKNDYGSLGFPVEAYLFRNRYIESSGENIAVLVATDRNAVSL